MWFEYSEVVAASNEKRPAKKPVQFAKLERFEITKYTAINGVTNGVEQFKKIYSHLNFGESTA